MSLCTTEYVVCSTACAQGSKMTGLGTRCQHRNCGCRNIGTEARVAELEGRNAVVTRQARVAVPRIVRTRRMISNGRGLLPRRVRVNRN